MGELGHFGLKIKLKKINPNYNPSGTDGDSSPNSGVPFFTNDFVALGHYDTIEIEKVDRLSDFRPGKEMEQRGDASFFDVKYYTEYTLKLFSIPEFDCYNEKYRYCEGEINGGDLPFIGIISVDLKDKCLKNVDKREPVSKYTDIIKAVCKQKDIPSNISIAPYCCLGYTDFVIMVRSNSLKAIQEYIEKLRKNENVSSTYTVYGLKKIAKYKNISKKEKLSVKFEWSFKDINSRAEGINFFDALKKIEDINFSSTCGVFDNYAEGEISEYEFYKLFCESNPYFDADSNPYGIVENFNTSLNFQSPEEKAGKQNASEKAKDGVLETLQTFLEIYKALIDKTNSHKRLYKAMKEMGRYYGHITFTCHSLDVQRVFGSFYVDFLKSLTLIIKALLEEMGSGEEKIVEKIESLDAAIEEFRDLFGTLLFDILRSDHAFFEAPSIAHPSIGSTTKLLLAYNNIVNEWNKQIETTDGHHYVSFLVTSGGCDKTKAHNLLYKFEDMVPPKGDDAVKGKSNVSDGYKLPVIITISEASLYDIEGTLFRLAHEFYHLKGNRNRLGRHYSFYEGLFYEYIDYCCHFIENESNILNGKHNLGDGEAETISSKDFKAKFDGFSSVDWAKYQTITEFLKELEDKIDIEESILKKYEKLAGDALGNILFSPAPAYANFKKILLQCSDCKEIRQSFIENFTYCEGNKRSLKIIDIYNDNLCRLFSDTIKDAGNVGESDDLPKSLKKIFRLVPYNFATYVKNTANYIPQMIGELSDIYARIEYGKNKELRAETKAKCGLVYDYYHDGKEYYNTFGFEEYSADCGGGIKYLPPQSEFYARLWLRATIAFFQDGTNATQTVHVPYNVEGYKDIMTILYKECFADACALNAFKDRYSDLEDLVAVYLSAFIFEQRSLNLFLELAYSDINMPVIDRPIQLLLALRIAVVIAGITKESSSINFNVDGIVDKIWDRVKDVFINKQGGNVKDNEVFEKYLKSALERIFSVYNGGIIDNELSGFKDHIYIRELVKYVKEGLTKKNKISCPEFEADDDQKNASLILEYWLKSYIHREKKDV